MELIYEHQVLVLSILNETGFNIISDQINRLLQSKMLNIINLQEYFTLPNGEIDILTLEKIITLSEKKIIKKSEKVISFIFIYVSMS